MTKKIVICSLILALLAPAVDPGFVNAMGSSSISDEAGLVILGVGIVVVFVAWYLLKEDDTEEANQQLELINKTVQKQFSPSGEFVVLSW